MKYKSVTAYYSELAEALTKADADGYEPVSSPVEVERQIWDGNDIGPRLYVLLRKKVENVRLEGHVSKVSQS